MKKIFALIIALLITSVYNNSVVLANEFDINHHNVLISEIVQDSYIELNDSAVAETSLGVSYDEANMINYNVSTGGITYEYFDVDSYPNRNSGTTSTTTTTLTNDDVYVSSGSLSHIASSSSIATRSIIGSDTRVQITNTKNWPFLGVAKIYMTYYNVLNQSNKKYYTLTYVGTGFMEGPNLLVTAGHCVYGDVTSDGNYNDNVSNPEFPDIVKVYCGASSSSDISSSYAYYAEAKIINIDKSYYENTGFDHDWAAVELDRNLGNDTGWYGKISNWFVDNAEVYSYGYPADKPTATMWESRGNLLSKTTYQYSYNFDSYGGQSGSPIFMVNDYGDVYVCGIHTSGGTSSNGGTRINSFIYHYLNSFVECYNYEHEVGYIRPEEYGFADAYPTDDITKTNYVTHTTAEGFNFQTRRYRTGYIHNEYIVMSPIRSGVTEAWIEYKFDIAISKITVELSHWRPSSNEWLTSSNGIIELQYWKDSQWHTQLDLLNDVTITTDRTNPNVLTIEFEEPVYMFRFYSKVNISYTNDSNRGRFCIGEIHFYSKEQE